MLGTMPLALADLKKKTMSRENWASDSRGVYLKSFRCHPAIPDVRWEVNKPVLPFGDRGPFNNTTLSTIHLPHSNRPTLLMRA